MSSIVKDIEEKGFFKFSEPDALSLIKINRSLQLGQLKLQLVSIVKLRSI